MSAPHYAGEFSREFWRRVNALPGRDQQEVYSLGVALQNLEEQLKQARIVRDQQQRRLDDLRINLQALSL